MQLKFAQNFKCMRWVTFCSVVFLAFLNACTDQVAGTTSETGNTLTGTVASNRPGGSVSFSKILKNQKYSDTIHTVELDETGKFEVKLDPNSTWFVKYKDSRNVAWMDSIQTGEAGERNRFNIENLRYAWNLSGKLSKEALPLGTEHRFEFEGTPFTTLIESDGAFLMEDVPLAGELIFKWRNEKGFTQKAVVNNWYSPWLGVQKIVGSSFKNNVLTLDYCTEVDTLELMVSATLADQGVQGVWNFCHENIAYSGDTADSNLDAVIQSGDLIYDVNSASVVNARLSFSESEPVISYVPQVTTDWNLLTATSLANNSNGAVGLYYLPSESKLAKSGSLDSLGRQLWIEEVLLDADSSYRVSLWGDEVLLYNSKGLVQVRSFDHLDQILLEFNVGNLVDLVQISPDQILVLRKGNLVESFEMTTGAFIAQKQFPAEPVLYDLGGLF